jgi:hypothetical protein
MKIPWNICSRSDFIASLLSHSWKFWYQEFLLHYRVSFSCLITAARDIRRQSHLIVPQHWSSQGWAIILISTEPLCSVASLCHWHSFSFQAYEWPGKGYSAELWSKTMAIDSSTYMVMRTSSPIQILVSDSIVLMLLFIDKTRLISSSHLFAGGNETARTSLSRDTRLSLSQSDLPSVRMRLAFHAPSRNARLLRQWREPVDSRRKQWLFRDRSRNTYVHHKWFEWSHGQ